jgi:PAS domain S-box-containing protein
MNRPNDQSPQSRSEEISALIERLHETEQRLSSLTAGEVDAVASRAGRTYVLQSAQEGLRRSEMHKQDAILNALPAQIALLDPLGTIVSVNERWFNFAHGYAVQGAAHAVGVNYLAVCDAATGDDSAGAREVADAVRALLRGELDTYSVEYACRSPGELRWYLLTAAPLADRPPTGVVVMHIDITDRKRAGQAMLDSQSFLRMAGRLALVGSWVVELPPDRVELSDVVATMHGEPEGFSPTVEEAIAYYAPEYQNLIRIAFVGCLEHARPFSVEAEIIRRDGTRIWIFSTGEAVRDAAGAIVRVQGAMQDLSERKAAERGARQQADVLTNVLESITDGFLTLDRQWRYTFVNIEAQRMLGRTREQLIGKVMWEEFPASLDTEFERGYRQAMVAKGGSSFESLYAPWNAWIAVHCYPSETGLSIYFRDVTQQRKDRDALRDLNAQLEARVASRTEELNVARQDAEQANRAKSAFLAAMSHEIRTPMNGVVGMIDVLEQSNLKSAQADIVKTVRQSAYALLRIVDDVLDFSKIEAGRLQIDREPMSIEVVVERTCDTLDRLAGSKRVSLRLFVDPEIPAEVRGDATRLRQVLLNLIGNAIKFSSADKRAGQVLVRAVLLARAGDSVSIEFGVSDDGIGMTAQTLARLFTPFTQADDSTTKRFGGTGLGLSISSRLAQLMGGRIDVSSEPGVGSTFLMCLPFAVEPVPAEADAQRALPLRGLRCLIVGSDTVAVDDLDAYLKFAGVRSQHADSLAAADRWFSEAPLGLHVAVVLVADASQAAALAESRRRWTAREHMNVQLVLIDSTRRGHQLTDAPGAINLDGNPMRRADFIEAVALAGGRSMSSDDEEVLDVADTLPMPIGDEDARTGRLILVAEDNDINQKVIVRQLDLLGFNAEIVSNGRQALECWRSGAYAMLLTDLHMPVMDGYELTVAIRREERGPRLPIVALTANALKGEARRCEALGMDDFMTKPMQLVELHAMLQKWMPSASKPLPLRKARTNDSRPRANMQEMPVTILAPAADLSLLIALVGNDPRVLVEMLASFCLSASKLGMAIRRGVVGGTFKAVADAAHTLKSGARSVGAVRLASLCEELETAAEGGRRPDLERQLRRFELELADVQQFITTQGAA